MPWTSTPLENRFEEAVRSSPLNNQELPRFCYLLFAALLTGNEFGGWAAVHPALDTLPPHHRLPAEQAVYRRYAGIMPVLMTATIAAAGPALSQLPRPSTAYRLSLASATCYATMLAITLTRNVPINRKLLALPDGPASYPEFARLRARWDRLHVARNLLNLSGLALAITAAVRRS
jgi:hypothetical protein